MLTFHGGVSRFCDGVPRRSFLKVGALSFGATSLTLADVYRAEAAAKANSPSLSHSQHKAIINVFLGGGPPHQDMFDLKMDAPAEIRGEFKPIKTNVGGIEVCEVFPKMAAMMDKFAIVRSIVGATGGHDAYQCTTGWRNESLSALGGRPSIGSVLAKLHGPVDPSVPPFVGLAEKTAHAPWSDSGKSGFLGSTFGAFRPNGPDIANMKMNGANAVNMGDRKQLLAGFDNLKRDLDANGSLIGMDSHTERAMNVLTSSRLIEALDVSKEDPKVRDRYGDGKPYKFQYDGAPTVNEHLLMARRLVQAGARCVSLSYGRWDSHGKNFDLVRDHGAKLDQCLSALVWDLERLDMLDDVTVIAWGEFGRTPRINKEAGRDHWPQVSCAVLAGGGIKTGQIVGSTNRLGEYAKDRPVTFGDMFATLYHSLGLTPETAVLDPTGRPQHVAEGERIRELV
ncbi:DUF1501 domain-containing protein [Limnoglobus roseus]|uniref:DUF1501 domain-containing protein n=1 Tax=Limnoglobus roseus TaxID=2598579 RepID=A0A5C1AJA8_9BACT|nr:DUF1501 domain-containing protein [Limnoglobus roseus]QEL16988.1 hypothetical protein PX52LOC_03964 [Limnoglobus roseus]